MSDKQKTIKSPVQFKGKGLHTGSNVEMTISPAPVNSGIVFVRTDMPNQPKVHAVADNVTENSRGTTITEGGTDVHTIEHLMASLNGFGIDNVIVELNGSEVPILDGSARDYAAILSKTGILEQEEEKDYYHIKEPLTYKDESKNIEISIYPDDEYRIDVLIDYNSKALGCQFASYGPSVSFSDEIAPSRTFVFLRELELLHKHNMIKGGDLNNAIIINDKQITQEELDRLTDLFKVSRMKMVPEGIINDEELRFNNEPARHKLLDMIGDMALVGYPLKGRIVARKPGHMANTELAKIIRKKIKSDKKRSFPPHFDSNNTDYIDVVEIQRLLPHRHPFLLIDRIIYRDEKMVCGVKNVTMNEPFFAGHFPSEPIMPGVLQIEAMAQIGGILVLNTVPDPENYITLFLKIDRVKFKRKVVPGDTIVFRLTLMEPIKRGIAHMWGEAFVGDNLCVEGELMAQIVKEK